MQLHCSHALGRLYRLLFAVVTCDILINSCFSVSLNPDKPRSNGRSKLLFQPKLDNTLVCFIFLCLFCIKIPLTFLVDPEFLRLDRVIRVLIVFFMFTYCTMVVLWLSWNC